MHKSFVIYTCNIRPYKQAWKSITLECVQYDECFACAFKDCQDYLLTNVTSYTHTTFGFRDWLFNAWSTR